MKSFTNKPPLKKTRTSKLNHVTVIASKGLGRVWSFNINFLLLLGIVVVLVLYFVFSFILLAQYFGEHRKENLLIQLEKDLQKTQRALYQAKQRLKFLENYIDPSKIPGENGISISRNSKLPAASGFGAQNPIVSVKGLKINRQGANLSITFKLTRSSPGRSLPAS